MRRDLGRLRIIGGEWRSRLVDFDAEAGVRPTPDRVRQTVFDWLSPLIQGSRVLDLFAGSGALGLEALSRGAAQATFIEQGAVQAQAIRSTLERFHAVERGEVIRSDALAWLAAAAARPATSYDTVFLDPPYDSDLLLRALAALPPLLAPVHRVYIEWPKARPPQLPPAYALLKEKAAGQVSYGLVVHRSAKELP
jgi:16S rRNA (guanine966-N2)-methyltransferase